MMIKKFVIVFFVLTALIGCNSESNDPICTIVSPANNSEINLGEIVTITAEATSEDYEIVEVRFYIDNVGVVSDFSLPFSFEWFTEMEELGTHTIKAIAFDSGFGKTESEIQLKLID